MQSITSIAGLKNAIQLLEVDQAVNRQRLKEQFHLTRESLKPVNLLKSTLKDIPLSSCWIDNILGTVMGLAACYLSKNIIVGASGKIFNKIFCSILQFGVTNAVAQHNILLPLNRSVSSFVNKYSVKGRNSRNPR